MVCTASTLLLTLEPMVQMLDNIVRRLTSLESAVTEANKFAEAEAVRCEQTEAITENLQAQSQVHDRVLAQHSSFHAAFQRHSTLVLPQVLQHSSSVVTQ